MVLVISEDNLFGMKYLLSFSILLLSCNITVLGQDPIYSQFFAAPLQINPASVGNTLAPRITMNYRSQWPSFNRAYVTYGIAYEQFFEPLNSSIGLMVQADEAGDGIYKQNNVSFIYGYRLAINKDFFLKMGIEIGGGQTVLDWDRLIFFDQLDALQGNVFASEESRPSNLSNTYLDLGTGLMAYGKQFYAGFSLKHINVPNQAILAINDNLNTGLPLRTTLHMGGEFSLQKGNKSKEGSFISPNAMFIKQGQFAQVNAGAYIGSGAIFGGIWYRHAFKNPDATIFLFGVQYDVLKIGYSYDFTVSRLASAVGGSGGAHEIALTFNFENSASWQRQKKATRYNDCLKIFR